jgi:hypothetical protein
MALMKGYPYCLKLGLIYAQFLLSDIHNVVSRLRHT